MHERLRIHQPSLTCPNPAAPIALALLTAALILLPSPAHSQFVAFNDHIRGTASSNNATFYTLTNAGPLKDITTGSPLPVSLTVTGYLCINNGPAAALASGPAYDTFRGYVDFSGYMIQMINTSAKSAHIITGLDPACRYSLKGSANCGNTSYTNRWTLFELLGADSLRKAHSPGCLTNNPAQGVALDSNQVAICTGMNTSAGAMFDWEDVTAATDGQLMLVSRKYTGPVPNGSNYLTAGIFGLAGLRLEETFRPVSIVSQPMGAVLIPGTPYTFDVSTRGTGPLSYQWRKNGIDIPKATNSTYTIPSVATNDSATYSVLVSNPESSALSSNADLLVGLYPPEIITQPASIAQVKGAPFAFSVTATGARPIFYHWFKDSFPISGATNPIYGREVSLSSDTGDYFVTVSNAVNVVTSDIVTLTLTNAPIEILNQPADQFLTQDDTANLSVLVNGTEPVYQWFKSGLPIANATNATYSFADVQPGDSGLYYVLVTNLAGAVTSRIATVGVAYAPACIVAPNAQWKYNASGADLGLAWRDPIYDDTAWLQGLGPLGFPVNEPMPSGSGLNIATIVPQIPQGSVNPATYYFRTTFNLPSAPSGMNLTVSNLIDDGAVFYLNGQELKRIRMPSGSITSQTMASQTSEVSYQGWDVFTSTGDGLCSGTNTLAVEVHQATSNDVDLVMHSIWNLKYSAPTLLAITNQPLNQTVAEAQPVSLNVGVQGVAGECQWFKIVDGSPVALPNAIHPILSFSNPLLGVDDGEYFLVVTNAINRVVSSSATLTITSSPPLLIKQPSGLNVCEGDSATFQITAYGSPSIFYQWRFNDSDIFYATNATYFIPSVSLSQAGAYSVTLSNSHGRVVSVPAVLQVTPRVPVILTQPQNFISSIGGDAYFDVGAIGCGITYQWQFNGTNVFTRWPAISFFSVTNLTPDQAGDYTVVVQNGYGSVTSMVAHLSFVPSSIGDALNCTNLSWSIDSSSWFAQGNVSLDGVAAQPRIIRYNYSTLEANFEGPGKLSYWCKQKLGTARFYAQVDGRFLTIDGDADWHRELFYFGSGTHNFRWRYYSESSFEFPQIWLDQVSYTTNVSPLLVSPLSNISTAFGDIVTFRAVAEGYPPLYYQWQFNGTDIIGADQPVLVVPNAQSANAGTYTLIMSNNYGVTTVSATLTLTNAAPLFHPQKSYIVAVPGHDCLIRANAYGSGPLSYQWWFQGSPISGERNDALLLREVNVAQAGVYSVIVSNSYGTAASPDIQLIVNPVSHVILLSLDGLGGKYLTTALQREPERYSNFIKMVNEGSTTLNARCDYDNSVTVPNHISMITGRPVLQPAGKPVTVPHGYTFDGTLPGTLHNNGNPAVPYKASVFDVAHDHGLTTAFIVGKTSLAICASSYDATNGAPDMLLPDNGRNKIDYVVYTGTTDTVDKVLASVSGTAPFNYYFLHFSDLDASGHHTDWGSSFWFESLHSVDAQLGRLLAAIETNSSPEIAFGTALIVTADHGGSGTMHDQNTFETVYTIPLFVWGPGFPGNTDLYTLFANRADPGTNYLDYNALWQPLRDGDTGNLALSILGLPPIPGSCMQPLFANTPWLALSTQDNVPTLEWSSSVTGFTLETSEAIGPNATWLPITTNILRTETRYTYPIPAFDPSTNSPHFYRLHKD